MRNLTLVGIALDRLPFILTANIESQGGSMSKIKYYVN